MRNRYARLRREASYETGSAGLALSLGQALCFEGGEGCPADVALLATGFPKVDSLDSRKNPPWPAGRSRKFLILSHNSRHGRWGGFRVDSPVKKPVASEMPRSAPPYTDPAREEPWEGGGVEIWAVITSLIEICKMN